MFIIPTIHVMIQLIATKGETAELTLIPIHRALQFDSEVILYYLSSYLSLDFLLKELGDGGSG